ncbi:MAG: DUF2336 domain-containing protein, partial [Pseudomonadota bacterium]
RRHRPRGMIDETLTVEQIRKTIGFAWRNPTPDVISAVAKIAGVSVELAGRIIRDPGGEPYAILCKALGLSRDEFFAFVQAGGAPDDEDHIAEAEGLLEVFDSIARDFSRAVLRYWDWQGNPRIERMKEMLGFNDAAA